MCSSRSHFEKRLQNKLKKQNECYSIVRFAAEYKRIILFNTRPDRQTYPPSLLYIGFLGLFPQRHSVKLIAFLHLAKILKISGDTPPLHDITSCTTQEELCRVQCPKITLQNNSCRMFLEF